MMLFDVLKNADIVLAGHFVLRSGRHSDLYINKDLILTKPTLFREIVTQFHYRIVNSLRNTLKLDISDLVISGPAVSGAIFSAPLSYSLDMPLVYPEKLTVSEKTLMVYRRGFDTFLSGKSVILIEDIVTTGGSVMQTIGAINSCGGTVVAVFSLWDRGSNLPGRLLSTKVHYETLVDHPVNSWEPTECPLCKNNMKFISNPRGEQ